VLEENSNSQNVNLKIISCRRGASHGSYRITLGDGSSFFLSADFVLKHRIKAELVIDSLLYNEIVNESEYVETYLKSLSLLSRQSYTRLNLIRKLNEKGYTQTSVDRTVHELESRGFIDDRDYAHKWVESRIRKKLDSAPLLVSNLVKKGISQTIAKSVVNSLYSMEVENRIIQKNIERLLNRGKEKDYIATSLSRKGFNLKKVLEIYNNLV